jgi:hypothetical protein
MTKYHTALNDDRTEVSLRCLGAFLIFFVTYDQLTLAGLRGPPTANPLACLERVPVKSIRLFARHLEACPRVHLPAVPLLRQGNRMWADHAVLPLPARHQACPPVFDGLWRVMG